MADESLTSLASGEVAQAFMDHMGGAAYIRDYVESDGTWMDMVTQLTQFMEKNVAYYVNAGVVDAPETQKRRMISEDGFPAYVKINYTFLSPGGFTPWSSIEDREIKQVVLHSFGQQWHAFQSSGKWFGVMNSPDKMEMYFYEETGQKMRWIPKGSDPDQGMAHKGRLAAALNACMFPSPGTAGVHFIISRSGDLYILADCNDVMNSAQDLSPTALTIALEEALYIEVESGQSRPVATWLPTGSPLGTDGTLGYWDWSEQQYLTLSILLKKLQTAYPALAVRTHTSSPGEATSDFVGYTMHSHISGADPRYTDVSPHLQTADAWTDLFDLVDQQKQITATNVWVSPAKGYEGRLAWAENIVGTLQNLGTAGLTQQMMTNPSLVSLMGTLRAHREFQNDNTAYRKKAAKNAALASSAKKVQTGMDRAVDRAMQSPLNTPSKVEGESECEWDI